MRKYFYSLLIITGVLVLSGCSQQDYSTGQNINATPSVQQSKSVIDTNQIQSQSVNSHKSPTVNSDSCGQGYYKNVDGLCVHSPSSNPQGATARCFDGTYSYSLHRQGTCSHHGGAEEWF
jgi:hypothetical protein